MDVANAFSAGGFEVANRHVDHLAMGVRETAKCGVWWNGVAQKSSLKDPRFSYTRGLFRYYGASAATSSGLKFSDRSVVTTSYSEFFLFRKKGLHFTTTRG
ncbi:unnamed protein product [Ectocarpus sp. 4 AP-2014]